LAVDLLKQGQSHDQLICLAAILIIAAHAAAQRIASDESPIGEIVSRLKSFLTSFYTIAIACGV